VSHPPRLVCAGGRSHHRGSLISRSSCRSWRVPRMSINLVATGRIPGGSHRGQERSE
jgi:hypothetical protein